MEPMSQRYIPACIPALDVTAQGLSRFLSCAFASNNGIYTMKICSPYPMGSQSCELTLDCQCQLQIFHIQPALPVISCYVSKIALANGTEATASTRIQIHECRRRDGHFGEGTMALRHQSRGSAGGWQKGSRVQDSSARACRKIEEEE